MALYDTKRQGIITNSSNNNNNSLIDSSIDTNNSYSMPSTTTTNESFANIGGLTQTTATLTPTTLKNIEESFMEIIPPRPHPQEARFVPPLVNISANYASIQVSNHNNLNNEFNNNSSNNSNSNTSDLDDGTDYETDESSSQSQSQWNAYIDRNNSSLNNSNQSSDNGYNSYNNKTTKQNGTKTRGRSGRKPLKNDKLSPEEEKKRQQRRERNKQAAARCRKRRMDHTNLLLNETDGLEDKRQSLLNEIDLLRKQKEELEFILEAHKTNCKLSANKAQQIDIKPVVSNGSVISMNSSPKTRPNSLSLSCIYGSNTVSDTGISIQTPSTGLFLDALAEGGTGLTPLLTPSIITPSAAHSLRYKSSPHSESPTLKKLVPL